MKVHSQFESEHKHFIHDLAYDYYGARLATCSSGPTIKVWTQDSDGTWVLGSRIESTHKAGVSRLAWAHPEFGSVLASCSTDRVVHIYEESMDPATNKPRWKNPGHLVDSRLEVTDIDFAPRQHGLKLATASLDGHVRLYESNDVMNLGAWPLVEDIKAGAECQSLSWNPSPFDPPMMAVGVGNAVQIYEYAESVQQWVKLTMTMKVGDQTSQVTELPHDGPVHDVEWAPDMGRQFHWIATASKGEVGVRVFKLKFNRADGTCAVEEKCLSKHTKEVWRVSWNITGTLLASTGDDGCTMLWKCNVLGDWHHVLKVNSMPPGGMADFSSLGESGAGVGASFGGAGASFGGGGGGGTTNFGF